MSSTRRSSGWRGSTSTDSWNCSGISRRPSTSRRIMIGSPVPAETASQDRPSATNRRRHESEVGVTGAAIGIRSPRTGNGSTHVKSSSENPGRFTSHASRSAECARDGHTKPPPSFCRAAVSSTKCTAHVRPANKCREHQRHPRHGPVLRRRAVVQRRDERDHRVRRQQREHFHHREDRVGDRLAEPVAREPHHPHEYIGHAHSDERDR